MDTSVLVLEGCGMVAVTSVHSVSVTPQAAASTNGQIKGNLSKSLDKSGPMTDDKR
jgi:hypothetical protein